MILATLVRCFGPNLLQTLTGFFSIATVDETHGYLIYSNVTSHIKLTVKTISQTLCTQNC